jgi:hypothetical protein
MRRLAAALALAHITTFGISAHAAYPNAKVTNRTEFHATGEINYASCKNDKFSVAPGQTWTGPGRGVCLITWIRSSLSGNPKTPGAKAGAVQQYSSSGTSYSNFIIQATENNYRVWSDHELKAENAKTREGKSPGFHITNKTMWPVAVALEQVGCLYYDTLKSGETFNRDTGAVWFTIKANIQADGKEPRKDWDCVKPVAIIVGTIIASAATAGAASFAALPAAGASIGAAALAPIATSTALIVAGASVGGAVAGAGTGTLVLKMTAEEIGKRLEPNSAASLKGQYAGPDWPFRCDQKPVYEITGGWGKVGQDKDGNLAIDPGTQLKIAKKNTCGNSMM